MTKIVYYIPNNSKFLDDTFAHLVDAIPCFINREYIEMDYSKVTITARKEDIDYVVSMLAPFMKCDD